MALAQVIREYGQAFRGDWGSIDGRSVRDEMEDIAFWMEADAYPGDEKARERLGICPTGTGHWTQYCEDDYCNKTDPYVED